MSAADVWHIAGLDLGQAADYTALTILEATTTGTQSAYLVRHLQRWALGTKYTEIVEDVVKILSRPPLSRPALVVDGTGVGAAVVDLFSEADLPGKLVPVVITGGQTTSVDTLGRLLVPKRELVSVLQVVLQSRRLVVAPGLPEARVLAAEMANLRVKNTAAGNETFAAWREGDHDDIVLAVAMAVYVAERATRLQREVGGEEWPEVVIT